MNNNRLFLSPPHMSGLEADFVRQAFESNYIAPLGPMVDAFEREFAEKVGIRYAAALSAGTAAMHLALRNLNTGPGDEVFVSDLTFIGSVTPALFQGARPVFIDSDRATWNMDPELLADEMSRCAAAGRLPKAVVPTDLYGQCCDVGRIGEICDKYGVPLVIDSAEAMGATYQRSEIRDQRNGSGKREERRQRGEQRPEREEGRPAAVQPRKTGETTEHGRAERLSSGWCTPGWGQRPRYTPSTVTRSLPRPAEGMLASDDGDFIERARFLSQQAKDPLPHYEHSEIGYNYRMSNIVAAIGRGQLQVLDERVERKREIFDLYRAALGDMPGIDFMPEAAYGRSNRWLTVILINEHEFGANREIVRLALEAENIESRPMWKPMHMQPVFKIVGEDGPTYRDVAGNGRGKRYAARLVGGDVSEELFGRGLCLPSGTQMTEADLDRVVKVIKRAQERVAKKKRVLQMNVDAKEMDKEMGDRLPSSLGRWKRKERQREDCFDRKSSSYQPVV